MNINSSQFQKIWGKRNNLMKLFEISDQINRAVAYSGSLRKFDFYWGKYGLDKKKFLKKANITGLAKADRDAITMMVRDNKIAEARDRFGKVTVGKTQYLYEKESSAAIGRTALGKMAWQFQTWGVNYASMLGDWARNKQYAKFARHIGQQAGLLYLLAEQEKYTGVTLDPFKILPATSISRFDRGLDAFKSPVVSKLSDVAKFIYGIPTEMFKVATGDADLDDLPEKI